MSRWAAPSTLAWLICVVAAEVGQQRPPDRSYETLEVVQFAGVRGGDQGGADLDDFHFLQGPAAFRGSGLQIDTSQ